MRPCKDELLLSGKRQWAIMGSNISVLKFKYSTTETPNIHNMIINMTFFTTLLVMMLSTFGLCCANDECILKKWILVSTLKSFTKASLINLYKFSLKALQTHHVLFSQTTQTNIVMAPSIITTSLSCKISFPALSL